MKVTVALVVEITPRMIAAFVIAGLIQVIVPRETIVQWMGHGSGVRGIFVGMMFRTVTPGGPMMHSPS